MNGSPAPVVVGPLQPPPSAALNPAGVSSIAGNAIVIVAGPVAAPPTAETTAPLAPPTGGFNG